MHFGSANNLSHAVLQFLLLLKGLEVGMCQGLDRGDPFEWIFLEHSGQQVQRIGVQPFVFFTFEGDVGCPVLREDLIVGFAWKSAHPQEKDMEDESQAENIADGVVFGLHIFDVDDLGSHVPRGSAAHKQIFLGVRKLSQSEIGNHALPTPLPPEKYILRFQITMHNPPAMHFAEPEQDGVHDSFRLSRFEFVLSLDFVVELATLEQLDRDV